MKNGFGRKEQNSNYQYIIKQCYKLPFIENIDKNILYSKTKFAKKI